MPKPSNPQNAPKHHGRKPSQPGYQGQTRSTLDSPCAVIALLMIGVPMLALGAGVTMVIR